MSWEAFCIPLVRVPALSAGAPGESPFRSVVTAGRAVDVTGSRLAEEGRALADALSAVVPSADLQTRRRLLSLRRDAFNNREIDDEGRWLGTRLLDGQRATEWASWCSARRELAAAEKALSESWVRAVDRSAQHIRRAATGRGAFRTALAISAPALAASALELPHDPATWNRRRRRLARELQLLEWRAAWRSTPLSLYASTAFGSWLSASARLELNRRIIQPTAAAAAAYQFARAHLDAPALVAEVEFTPTGRVVRMAPDGFRHYFAQDGSLSPLPPWAVDLLARFDVGGPRAGRALLDEGVDPLALDEATDAGWLRVRWPGDGLDQRPFAPTTFKRHIWSAVLADVGLLGLLGASPEPASRVRLGGAGAAPGATSDLEFDTACEDRVTLASAGFERILSDASHWGAAMVERSPTPARQATAALLNAFFGARETPFSEFVATLVQLLRAAGLPPSLAATPPFAARALGVGLPDAPHPLERSVRQAFAGHGTVVDGVSADVLRRATSPRRAAFRCVCLETGYEWSAARITFWGGDRMSYIPRYGRLPGSSAVRLRPAFREWLRPWPELVDLDVGCPLAVDQRPRLTRRRLVGPDAGRTRHDLGVDDLVLLPMGDSDVIIRTRRGGSVDPVFFGVLAEHRLPLEFRMLLALGPPQRSAIAIAVETLSRLLADRLSTVDGVEHLRAVWMTGALQLSPGLTLVPTCALPSVAWPEDRDGFLAFHRWAERVGIEAGRVRVRAREAGPDGLVVDLEHPAGVGALYRLSSACDVGVVVIEPLSGTATLTADDGEYNVEYAFELRTA